MHPSLLKTEPHLSSPCPPNLRLQIYSYLTNDPSISVLMDSQFAISRPMPKASTTYSYLYRSPGRMTRPNTIPRAVMRLFQINHIVRIELLDRCFAKRTFVLEASLYSQSIGGLRVLPPQLGVAAWVRKLLILTTLDSSKCLVPKGIADLRSLQAMTNLEEVRIVFRMPSPPGDMVTVANNPIRAVLDAVPPHTRVIFGADSELQSELLRELGSDLSYLFQNAGETEAGYERVRAGQSVLEASKGYFSGSRMNHGLCRWPNCGEGQQGVKCVNAQTMPPTALPAVELMSKKEL